MQRPLTQVFLGLIASLFPLSAQQWERLPDLAQGTQIKVEASGTAEYKGRFQSATSDAISLETDRGFVSVERTRVRRVGVRSRALRIRRVVIAAAIGLALGATVDRTIGQYFRNETGETAGARTATYIAPSAVLGAIAGAFPAYRTIYKVP
jgi:hypothetical protein